MQEPALLQAPGPLILSRIRPLFPISVWRKRMRKLVDLPAAIHTLLTTVLSIDTFNLVFRTTTTNWPLAIALGRGKSTRSLIIEVSLPNLPLLWSADSHCRRWLPLDALLVGGWCDSSGSTV